MVMAIFLVSVEPRRFGRAAVTRATVALAAALAVVAALPSIGRADDTASWTSSLKHLTPAQGQTLLKLSRDFYPHDELGDEPYARCIDPYDAAAADPQAKQALEESLQLVQGASRRMGYPDYFEISDDYERLRLAKMLGESPWLRAFRAKLRDCLNAQPEVKATLGEF